MQDNNPQLNNDPNQQQPQITPPDSMPQQQAPQPVEPMVSPQQPQQVTGPTVVSPQPQMPPNTFAQPQAPQMVQPTVVQPQQFTPQQPTVQQPMPVMPGAIVGGSDVPVQQQQPFQASMPAQMPQNGKSKKKIIIAGVALLSTLLLVGLGIFLYFATQLSPEDRFSKTINNMASLNSVQSITQVNSTEDEGVTNAKLDMSSDLSDVSNVKFKANVNFQITSSFYSLDFDYDLVCVSNKECYINYKKSNTGGEELYKLNTWGKFDPNKTTEFGDLGDEIVLSQVIIGNITGNAKDQITTASNNKEIYTIKDFSDDTVDSTKVIKYNTTVNKDKLFNLLKTVAEQYKLDNPVKSQADLPDTITFWVNPKNNYVLKYEYKESTGNTSPTVMFSNYNTPVEINTPSDSVDYQTIVQM